MYKKYKRYKKLITNYLETYYLILKKFNFPKNQLIITLKLRITQIRELNNFNSKKLVSLDQNMRTKKAKE